MDFYKKYTKYKNKYLNLKNKYGMVDISHNNVMTYQNKTESYDDILIKNIGMKFRTAIDNHIHELNGFLNMSSGNYYLIENILIKTKIKGILNKSFHMCSLYFISMYTYKI